MLCFCKKMCNVCKCFYVEKWILTIREEEKPDGNKK